MSSQNEWLDEWSNGDRTAQYHSDLHRDITLYLVNNRHIPMQERIAAVKLMIKDMDYEKLAHYAACCFITLDAGLWQAEKLPEHLNRTMVMTKNICDHLESERELQKVINANKGRVEAFAAIEERLKLITSTPQKGRQTPRYY
ncbi:MAG: hypothetical protein QX199_16795 [Methylococcaceae bacterium]